MMLMMITTRSQTDIIIVCLILLGYALVVLPCIAWYNHIKPVRERAKELERRIATIAIGQVWVGTDGNPFDRLRLTVLDIQDGYIAYNFLPSPYLWSKYPNETLFTMRRSMSCIGLVSNFKLESTERG